MTFLEVRSVSKSYGAIRVLDDVALTVGERTKTAIVGPSGSGKTTLLRILAGFEWPDLGSVTLSGRCLASKSAIVPAHKRNIGIVSQDGSLFPHLSVAENIGFALDRHAPERGRRIEELIEMVGMDRSFLSRNPDQLSGGQQQRVALARALARKPRLMLLDEPFSALDTALRVSTRRAVGDMLDAAGVTTILVTHDQVEALSFADQVAVMSKGRIVQADSPSELYRYPATPMIAEFLGDAIIVPADLRDGFADCLLGAVKIPEGTGHGRRHIMLRPEQIVLGDATTGSATDGTPLARARAMVESVEFCGAFCVVRLRFASSPDTTPPRQAQVLELRISSLDAVKAGAAVAIATIGTAHVF